MYFFGLEILMPGIFLGLRFQACVFFGVCNMKLRRTPPVMYTSSTPPGVPDCWSMVMRTLGRRLVLHKTLISVLRYRHNN